MTTNDDSDRRAEEAAEAYTPDDDAQPLDAALMRVAQRLHVAGWDETPERLAAALAVLREMPNLAGEPDDPSPAVLYDALTRIADSATNAAQCVAEAFPDRIAMTRP